MTYGKRVVLLRGGDKIIQVENGIAGGAIRPGHLVDGVSSVVVHATAAGVCPRAIALERDEFGTGIDETYIGTNNGTPSPYYASGDQVKVALCHPGVQFTGWVASGQNITENDRMESAGDGSFRKYAAGTILARALETLDMRNTVGPSRIKLEIM
jgi:hypothetical protein